MGQRAQVAIVACLQIAVSVGILSVLLRTAGWQSVRETVTRVDGLWLVAAVALLSFQQLLSANRWRVLTNVLGGKGLRVIHYILWQGLAVLLLQVLPSTVGGDIVRAGSGARSQGLGLGVGVVVVERVIGMVVLCLFVVLGALAFSAWLELQPALLVPLAIAGVGLGACAVLTLSSDWLKGRRFALRFDVLGGALKTSMKGSRGASVWGISLLMHVLSIVAVSCLLRATHVSSNALGALFFIVPAALLVSALPISMGGWGVREGAFVVGLSLVGIAKEDALSVSVLFGLSLTGAGMVLATIGGVGHVVHLLQPSAASTEADRDSSC